MNDLNWFNFATRNGILQNFLKDDIYKSSLIYWIYSGDGVGVSSTLQSIAQVTELKNVSKESDNLSQTIIF